MNRNAIAFSALAIALACVVVGLVVTSSQLPQNVASHFNGAGVSDGWMSRESYLWTMGGAAVGLSVFLVGIFYCIRYFPTSTVNLPDRDYWLAAERRDDTLAFLFRAGVWLAVFEAVFMFGIHLLIVSANQSQPAQLSSSIWLLAGAFLLVTFTWCGFLVLRFRRRT